jgi:UDP-N-acetylglucosamine--N-acetylmuramyl-(pentapeptide) pyrophosphoryl-undecaprenol N-acetylglucosamine transferase
MGFQNKKLKLAIGAGGTGGHIIPALAFANWLRGNHPEVEFKFFCGARNIEKEIYSAHSIEPEVLPIEGSPMWGNLFQRTSRLWRMMISFGIVSNYFKKWKPDVVITFGGYVSLPLLYVSFRAKIPAFVHEQNVIAGKVTKLAYKAGFEVLSGWEKLEGVKEYRYVGIPLRRFQCLPRWEAWHKLNMKDHPPSGPIVLSLGGSLFSEKMRTLALKLASRESFKKWFFLVLGDVAHPNKLKENVYLLPKTWEVGNLYSLADIVISRAGASTLAELSYWNIPAIVVPWLEAADGHQLANAKLFEEKGYGRIWLEGEENIKSLENKILDLHSRRLKKKTTNTMADLADRSSELVWESLKRELKGDVDIDGEQA